MENRPDQGQRNPSSADETNLDNSWSVLNGREQPLVDKIVIRVAKDMNGLWTAETPLVDRTVALTMYIFELVGQLPSQAKEELRARVTTAAILQDHYSGLPLKRRQLKEQTLNFVPRQKFADRQYVPGRIFEVPSLYQLKLLSDNGFVSSRAAQRVDETIRILIAQELGIDLPPGPSELPSVK
ncbi:hypothetical protein HY380_01955 [Candidatus Saccharibacteria bacterium]|nr:hypothetical protein [Candidatus Saccharibacteria bacterium]